MAWVAKGNEVIFDFVYLCPSTVPCLRGRLVRPTTRQFQKLHVVPNVSHDAQHTAMPDLTVHLLLDPREGHLRLGGKVQYSSARFHAAISRIDSPSFDISPNIPTVGAFNSYSLSLPWNGVAPGTLVSNLFARAS